MTSATMIIPAVVVLAAIIGGGGGGGKQHLCVVEAWMLRPPSRTASGGSRRRPHVRAAPPRPFPTSSTVLSAASAGDDDDDDASDDDSSDWKAFKARLVNMELREAKHLDGDDDMVFFQEDGVILNEEEEVVGDDVPPAASPSSTLPSPSSTTSFSSSASSPNSIGSGEEESSSSLLLSSAANLWAYDVITDPLSSVRPGSVLLYRPLPPDALRGGYYGYGLGRQYLHKSVVLIQEVNAEFVTGVLLNRGPYGDGWGLRWDDNNDDEDENDDDDDDDEGNEDYGEHEGNDEWDVWFGGDARSLVDDDGYVEGGPVFYCLHDIERGRSEEVDRVSMERFPGVQFTTPTDARTLVDRRHAVPADFWTFCGYLHWSSEHFAEEVNDGLWHVTETDPAALFSEMKRLRRCRRRLQSKDEEEEEEESKHDDAGIRHWDALMEMITRRDECVVECEVDLDDDANVGKSVLDHSFDDAMLREWTRDRLTLGGPLTAAPSGLVPSNSGDGGGIAFGPSADAPPVPDASSVRAGDVVRALCPDNDARPPGRSSRPSSSPFLLSDHEFHKSLILITQDDEHFTVGVVLNIPSARTAEMQAELSSSNAASSFFFPPANGGGGPVTVGSVPVRYGGPYDFVGPASDVPLFFLHRCRELAEAGVGELVGGDNDDGRARSGGGGGIAGVWRCSVEQATDAVLRRGISSAQGELLAVNGFCVWEKDPAEESDGGDGGGGGGIREEIAGGRFEVVRDAGGIGRAWDLLRRQSLLTDERSVEENLRLSNAAWEAAAGGGGKASMRLTAMSSSSSSPSFSLADAATRRWVEGFLLGEADFRASSNNAMQ